MVFAIILCFCCHGSDHFEVLIKCMNLIDKTDSMDTITYIHIYIHTCIHTYMRTYIPPFLILLGLEACIRSRPFDVWLIWVISIEYWIHAVSQSLPMSAESTFEGVDGRCFNDMVCSRHSLSYC